MIIGHPFNPVYLLPLVETVPGEKTSRDAMDRAGVYFESIGMHVLRLKKEIDGYICDRLQEALWREALHILNKGIGTTEDIDNSIVYSAGMRWAFMGSFLTYHLAGGPGGMRDFIKQFDPTLELPWTDLPFPKWNETLEKRLVEGCEVQAAGRTVAEIEAKRNDVLVDMMHLFKQHGVGAGLILQREEESARKRKARWTKGAKIAAPVALHRGIVQSAWVDYNGHMSDAYYLVAFGDALDAFFRYIGDDEAYRATGQTFFTAETHLNYFREMKLAMPSPSKRSSSAAMRSACTSSTACSTPRPRNWSRPTRSCNSMSTRNPARSPHARRSVRSAVSDRKAHEAEEARGTWPRDGGQKEVACHQRVMITAAAAGIGRSIARAFADEGAKVHICDVNEAALAEFRDENPEIAATHVNVRSEGEIEAWFDDALDDLGGLDVLINNAGIKGPTALVDDIDYADWRECIEICLDSHFLCARRAAPVMKAQSAGSIINLSSMAGQYGFGNRSPYAAAKWAIVGLTKSLAIELGPFNVRCNAICPGTVRGERINRVIPGEAEIARRYLRRGRQGNDLVPVDQALCRARRNCRSLPFPRLARLKDDLRPGDRPRWPPRNLQMS